MNQKNKIKCPDSIQKTPNKGMRSPQYLQQDTKTKKKIHLNSEIYKKKTEILRCYLNN